MEQLWYVVEFTDKSTAVVPTSWVNNGQCLWPPRDSVNIQKAVKQQTRPTPDWAVYEQILCLATCDTYEKAIGCLKKSVEPSCPTSDIESEMEQEERRKRKSKPNPKYVNIFSDPEEEYTAKRRMPRPPPILSPDLYQNYKTAAEALNHTWPEDNFHGYQNSPTLPSEFPHTSADVQPQPHQLLRDMGLSKVLQMLAQTLEENRETKEELKKLTQEVKALRRDLVSQNTERTSPSVIRLPLGTMAELDQAEIILKNPEERQKMVSYFAITGGHTQDILVRRMLACALTNSLASQMNWAGKGHKRAFKDTALHDVMSAALQKQLPGSTQLQFAETIKKWLKYAPEREGGVPRK
ncbi:uncharacterized protein LOC111189375 isoform X2 [Astyanax mexicanus]|uniref:uncharacterized protein LOC111189375 isoform X2 n=1 Tax=Astyanax mexicanus TaxID=7994 RepID=UPI0020CAE69E|nr:uncharacterized protein LOC111189375 isoform X2 [Astyanax mexicanus]